MPECLIVEQRTTFFFFFFFFFFFGDRVVAAQALVRKSAQWLGSVVLRPGRWHRGCGRRLGYTRRPLSRPPGQRLDCSARSSRSAGA